MSPNGMYVLLASIAAGFVVLFMIGACAEAVRKQLFDACLNAFTAGMGGIVLWVMLWDLNDSTVTYWLLIATWIVVAGVHGYRSSSVDSKVRGAFHLGSAVASLYFEAVTGVVWSSYLPVWLLVCIVVGLAGYTTYCFIFALVQLLVTPLKIATSAGDDMVRRQHIAPKLGALAVRASQKPE